MTLRPSLPALALLFGLAACAAEGAGGPGGDCVPLTCASMNATCGELPDSCGAVLNCGACTTGSCIGYTCQAGGGTCSPATCSQLGAKCGEVSDQCNSTLQCGDCPAGSTCQQVANGRECAAPGGGDCGDMPGNECGGCAKLEGTVGESCGCDKQAACDGDSLLTCEDGGDAPATLPPTDDSSELPVMAQGKVESLPNYPDQDRFSVFVSDAWNGYLEAMFEVSRAAGMQSILDVCVAWQSAEGEPGPLDCGSGTLDPNNGCCQRLAAGATTLAFPVGLDWSDSLPVSDDSGTWTISVKGAGSKDSCEAYLVKAWF